MNLCSLIVYILIGGNAFSFEPTTRHSPCSLEQFFFNSDSVIVKLQ